MGEIYWLIQTLADVSRDDSWLSAREQAIASRMYFEKRRQDWRLGRWAAKQTVLRYLKLRPDPAVASSLEIIAAPDGAPEAFLHEKPAPISLSISHSAGTAFCAVCSAGIPLGCDLEEIRPREANFAADYLTCEELLAVEKAGHADRDLLITLIWSAKESVLKALRHGLRRDTRSVQVLPHITIGKNWSPLAAVDLETAHSFHGWWRAEEDRVQTIASDVATRPPVEILVGP